MAADEADAMLEEDRKRGLLYKTQKAEDED